MAKKYILPTGNRHPHGLDAIVRVFPKISEKTKDDSDQYYRQQVLLHVPWRYEDQILDKYETWEQAYLSNELLIKGVSDIECPLEDIEPDDPEFEEETIENRFLTEQFMTSSVMGPCQRTTQIELGRREMDVNYDWHESLKNYDQYGGIPVIKSFIKCKKKVTDTVNEVPIMPNVEFTTEQQTVLNLLKLQIQSIKEQNMPGTFALPQSVIVQGKAGKNCFLYFISIKY